MSLTNLGMNQGFLVCTFFVIFLYILKSLLLMFLCLTFSQQQELNPKVVDSFQYFCACFEVWNFVPNLKINFIVFLSIVSNCISDRCSFPYNILRRAPIINTWRPSDSGSGDPDPIILIQCVNGREPMSQELWSHILYGISRAVHPTEQV